MARTTGPDWGSVGLRERAGAAGEFRCHPREVDLCNPSFPVSFWINGKRDLRNIKDKKWNHLVALGQDLSAPRYQNQLAASGFLALP